MVINIMGPRIITLEHLDMLHVVFRGYRSQEGFAFLFRGQADDAWDVLPKAGRKDFLLPDNRDLGRFLAWSRQAVAYTTLPSNDLEMLAIAQHHGLATRLLDWTMNPLVACFFACSECPKKDGAVYIVETPDQVVSEEHTLDNLKNLTGVYAYLPKSVSPRLLNQKGVFTIHCDASQKIAAKESRLTKGMPNLVILKIPAGLKFSIIKHIEDYGVDRSVLFPDLDGLSALVNQKTIRIEKDT